MIQLSIIFFLLYLAYQDFRYRAISWWLIPLLFVGIGYFQFDITGGQGLKENLLLNLGFVIVQLIALTAYFSIKNRKLVNIIDTYIGLGDVLFMLVLTMAFSFLGYIAFLIGSMAFTLIAYLIYKRITRIHHPEIPLAGAMASMLALLYFGDYFWGIQFDKNLLLF